MVKLKTNEIFTKKPEKKIKRIRIESAKIIHDKLGLKDEIKNKENFHNKGKNKKNKNKKNKD
jgi:hypothetical protein